jgi:hypothetical protein
VNQTEVNGGHINDRTLDRTRSLFDRTRSVSVQRLRVSQFVDRTWWRVWSRLTGRVWSLRELTGLQPGAGTVASGQFCSASGRCFVVRCSGLTSASGPLQDQRVRSLRGARPVGGSRAYALCDRRVRSIGPVRPVSVTATVSSS